MQTFAGLLKANTAVRSPTSRIDTLEDLMSREDVYIYYPRNMIIDTILHVSRMMRLFIADSTLPQTAPGNIVDVRTLLSN